ncbi:hypothetical protein BV902_14410 [Sphingobacterium sp. B29]|nr:hypothetical protein BV902_14410 [Sphingobacterium sp. B29]
MFIYSLSTAIFNLICSFLFKHPNRWSENQKYRPKLKLVYDLGIALGDIFNKCQDKKIALTKLGLAQSG